MQTDHAEAATPGRLGKTSRLLRELGPVGFASRVLRRLTHSVVDTGSVTFFVKITHGEAPVAPLSGFRVRRLRTSDKEALLYGSESRWETLLARFQGGDLCFGAVDEQGRAVHTRWLTLTGARIPELEMDFVPATDAAYFYDGYTRPDARRHGIDAVVRAVIFEDLRAMGRARVYSYVRDDNPPGRRAAARSQQAVATVRYVRAFGSRPLVLNADASPLGAQLQAPHPRAVDENIARAADWRAWFEGWLKEPISKRSIGFHELPDDAFKAMAHHISVTLHLDASRDLVLDLGCDSALVTRLVAPTCARLVGVDFIPGMLVDAKQHWGKVAPQTILRFAAADGRALPFPSATFGKAYCSGVVHTLPTLEDGLAMILDLIRVSKPGGQVLIAAVPDVRKRWQARREAWTLGNPREKVHIIAAMALPKQVKRLARHIAPWLPKAPLLYLEYDLRKVKRALEGRGLKCTILDYPRDFWSRDFRQTRSNLLIDIPSLPA